MSETGGFALAPQTIICRINIVGAVEPEGTAKHPSPKTSQEKGDAGSTRQSSALHRALMILIKVPCSIVASVGISALANLQ